MSNNEILQYILMLISVGGGIISFIFGVALHKKIAVQLASYFLILTGVIVTIGYLVDAPTIYTIPPTKQAMAFPTGICFSITGGCLLVLVNELDFKPKRK